VEDDYCICDNRGLFFLQSYELHVKKQGHHAEGGKQGSWCFGTFGVFGAFGVLVF
jgi:hypothetical protein